MAHSLLGTLGTASFLATTGYAGTLAYREIQAMKNFESIRQSFIAKEKPIHETMKLADNLKATGLNNIFYQPETLKIESARLAEMSNKTGLTGLIGNEKKLVDSLGFAEEDFSLLNQIVKDVSAKTGHTFHVQVAFNRDSAAHIKLNANNGTSFSLGNFAHGGRLQHASSGSLHNVFVGNFLNEDVSKRILNGEILDAKAISNGKISFNRGKLLLTQKRLSRLPRSVNANAIKSSLDQLHLRLNAVGVDIPNNPYLSQIQQNTLMPLLFDNNNNLVRWNVNEDMIQTFTKNLGRLNINGLHYGLSTDSMASGIVVDPLANIITSNLIRNLTGKDEMSHAVRQSFSRSVTPFGSHFSKFANKDVASVAGQTNLGVLQSLYIKDGDELWKKILMQGYGNNGLPMPDVGKEGGFITQSLANRALEDEYSFSLKLRQDNGHVGEGLEALLNELVTYSINNNHSTNKFTTSIQKQMLEARNAGDLQSWRANRNAFFADLINNDKMQSIIGGYAHDVQKSNEFNITRFLKSHAPNDKHLFADITGSKNHFKRPGRLTLRDIQLTEDGIGFKMRNRYRFRDSLGKIWGSQKTLAGLRVMNNKDAAFMYLVAQRDENVRTAIMNGTFTNDMLRQLKITHKDFHKNLPSDLHISHQFIRGKEGGPIYNMTMQERQSLIGKIGNSDLTNLYNKPFTEATDYAMTPLLASFNQPFTQYGYDFGGIHNTNVIHANRLRSAGLESAATWLESHYDTYDHSELLDTYMPMFNRYDKHHVRINAMDITDESINKLTGQNVDDAIAEAQRLTKLALKTDNVSPRTRLYVTNTLNPEMPIPIPLTKTNYTFGMNKYHFDDVEEPISRTLSTKTATAIRAAQSGDESWLSYAHKDLRDFSIKTLFDPATFTKVPVSEMSLAGAADEGLLQGGFLKDYAASMENGEERVQNVLKKYGLDMHTIDDAETIHGMSNKRFAATAKNASQLDAYMIIGRDPAYAAEGISVSRAIDAEQLTKDLYALKGVDQKDPRLKKYLDNNMFDHMIFTNQRFRRTIGADLDLDTIKSLFIDDAAVRKTTAAEIMQRNEFMQDIYDEKGILKAIGKKETASILEQSSVEKEGIAKAYKAALPYQQPFADYSSVLKGDAKTVANKSHLLNAIFTNLPENFIGNKLATTHTGKEAILAMLSHDNADVKSRVKTLRDIASGIEYHRGPNAGSKVFDSLFSDDELEGLFHTADKKARTIPNILKFISGDIRNERQVNGLLAELGEHGFGSGIKEAGVRELEMALPTARKAQRIGNSIADIAENVIPKVLKNKTVLALGATSLLAGILLQSPDNAIKHQEVREESRPKEIPQPAAAIDRPSALVARPLSRGYRMLVKGKLPRGVHQSQLNSGLNQIGMSTSSTYIDKNDHVESDYVKKLQDEDRYNKWNIG